MLYCYTHNLDQLSSDIRELMELDAEAHCEALWRERAKIGDLYPLPPLRTSKTLQKRQDGWKKCRNNKGQEYQENKAHRISAVRQAHSGSWILKQESWSLHRASLALFHMLYLLAFCFCWTLNSGSRGVSIFWLVLGHFSSY